MQFSHQKEVFGSVLIAFGAEFVSKASVIRFISLYLSRREILDDGWPLQISLALILDVLVFVQGNSSPCR